jgi:transposase
MCYYLAQWDTNFLQKLMKHEFLTEAERIALKARHRKEKDCKIKDRIKAVLLADKGWMYRKIAEALFVDEETVSKHIKEYKTENKLQSSPAGGSQSKLSKEQTAELIEHLDKVTYTSASQVCSYVQKKYNITYTVNGMTDWLNNNGFSFKKPHEVPARADPDKQEAFKKEYEILKKETPDDEPIVFLDAVHPTMATKASYGWIKKGYDKPLKTTASRTRMNVVGALNLKNMQVDVKDFPTVNSDAMIEFLAFLKSCYPDALKIHVILDNGPYNSSQKTKEYARNNGIILHYLPPYSPNLNSIERLWKVMNETVRNNRFFTCPKEFRGAISEFFTNTWAVIAETMRSRINDHFQTIPKSMFSG